MQQVIKSLLILAALLVLIFLFILAIPVLLFIFLIGMLLSGGRRKRVFVHYKNPFVKNSPGPTGGNPTQREYIKDEDENAAGDVVDIECEVIDEKKDSSV